MSIRILITGARSAVALDMAREFHRAGYEVHMADCSSAFIARWSNAVHAFHRHASPVANPDGFTKDIKNLVANVQPHRVIPTCEEAFHLAKPSLHESIGYLLFAPDAAQLALLHNKSRFMALCEQAGIATPASHILISQEEVRAFESPQDWVFKPCYSRFGAHTLIGPTAQQLARINPTQAMPWLAQQRIHGQEFSFYAVAQQGRVVCCASYHSAWRLKGGASYAFTPAETNVAEAIEIIATRLANALQLNGQFSCDLMQDSTGKLWPIECNPRVTSGLHLLCGNGALAQAIMNATPTLAATQTRYMLPMMLLHGWGKASWLQSMREGRDVLGVQNDMKPLYGAMLDTCIFGFNALRRRTTLAQATTADIEWNGEQLT
ncbi:MAG: ATP-grasp domain-containing protein [Alphaproteobacteria bacterium]|nr:ATP-grasp domain-containing protein [Alphaproteobacteria bacterium]